MNETNPNTNDAGADETLAIPTLKPAVIADLMNNDGADVIAQAPENLTATEVDARGVGLNFTTPLTAEDVEALAKIDIEVSLPNEPYALTHDDCAKLNVHLEGQYAEAGEILHPSRNENGKPYVELAGGVRVVLGEG